MDSVNPSLHTLTAIAALKPVILKAQVMMTKIKTSLLSWKPKPRLPVRLKTLVLAAQNQKDSLSY